MDIPNLHEATVAQLQDLLASKQLTSRDLVQYYLARIEAIDRSGPALRSVVEINPDVFDIADALDTERAAGSARGPMHGIPILLKDNLDTADRMMSAAGSLALVGQPAARDAFVVQQLRRAGAVILGKTNLSEWANFRSTNSSSGWSGRGGQTRNPYAIDRSPSGSSSGSAVAVSAGLCAVSVGTETDGSITSPAASCGIVGIKPTVGLTSRFGVIPIAATQDTAGPFGRTVADAAILLGAMTGIDPHDAATNGSAGNAYDDYTGFLGGDGLQGIRIGVPRKIYAGYHTPTDRVLDTAIEAMRRCGAEIIDPADLPSAEEMRYDRAEITTLLYEFKAGINAYLQSRGDTVAMNTLADLIRFNEEHANEEMPYFGQERFTQAEETGPLTEHRYQEALHRKLRLARDEGIDAVMDEHRLDALMAATHATPWLIDPVNGDQGISGSSTSPAAVAGYPSISVPAGQVFGLPIGILLFGRPWSEPTLLRIAAAFERETRARTVPAFLPTAPV